MIPARVPFAEATRLQPSDAPGEPPLIRRTGTVTPDWAQGRAAFGGLLGAMAARGLSEVIAADRPIRSLILDFMAPVAPGTVDVEVRPHRAGRAISHGEVRFSQRGELVAVAVAAFGASRPSSLTVPSPPIAPAEPPELLPSFPYVEGVFPAFTQHFDLRWVGGRFPYAGQTDASIGGWVRLHDVLPFDAALVLALLDAWPAPVLPLMHAPAPSSTVTWMVDFLVDPASVPAGAWCRFEGRTEAAGDGYASVEGRLWAQDGRLLAVSRQTVVEFS